MSTKVLDEPLFEVREPRAAWNAILVSLAVWNRQFELALAASASFALRGRVRAKPEEEQEADIGMADGWHIGQHEAHPALRLLANVFLRPQRQQGKRDKVVLADLAPYRKPWRDWPLFPTGHERALEPRTAPVTATERARQREYKRDHREALARLNALSNVEEWIDKAWSEYRDTPASEE
jgi:hypothetical protein